MLDSRCVPKYGGVLIDMKKMDKILEINEADLACMHGLKKQKKNLNHFTPII